MQRGNTLPQLPVGDDSERSALENARTALGEIILGKDTQIELALACLLARGHLLIEDLPGLGKTILAQSLARMPQDTEGLRGYLEKYDIALCGGWCSGNLLVNDLKDEIAAVGPQVAQFVALGAP